MAEPNLKDKEEKLFYQIMKCCKYFSEQEIDGFTSDGETSVVTLLTGRNLDDRKILTYNPDELAESEGSYILSIFALFFRRNENINETISVLWFCVHSTHFGKKVNFESNIK